jgi:TPR repeat protein
MRQEDAAKAARSARKASLAQVSSPAPTASIADSSEAEGEKYLYGTGVPQNCDRAQKSLMAAASRADAKAQSVLGTMYATGHCAPRDLPLAYKWFAKALHQDPNNDRLSQDLRVLWNQMTPDERQLALRNE